MSATKAGPIQRGDTTMDQMRRWFGPPTVRKVVRVGCVRVARIRWEDDLVVYAARRGERTVEGIFVRSRAITSSRDGQLEMHTRQSLRVGDREREVRRSYPEADRETHRGHTHYRLRTASSGEYLMAKVVSRRVVQLEVWPYEFC